MCIQEAVVTVGIGIYCIHRVIVIEGSYYSQECGMMCVVRITVSRYGCGMGGACKVSVFMRVLECVVGA